MTSWWPKPGRWARGDGFDVRLISIDLDGPTPRWSPSGRRCPCEVGSEDRFDVRPEITWLDLGCSAGGDGGGQKQPGSLLTAPDSQRAPTIRYASTFAWAAPDAIGSHGHAPNESKRCRNACGPLLNELVPAWPIAGEITCFSHPSLEGAGGVQRQQCRSECECDR